jgi:8-oxo-dGTP pyrophosphatase MutT (NUDIX family)
MDGRLTARALPGKGLAGCANNSRTRQVTIIEREVWEELMTETGGDAPPSVRRANLMVSGLQLVDSRNRLLRAGTSLLRIAGETKPCETMDKVITGLRAAMYPAWRGGAFAQVLEEGDITVGDSADWAGRVVSKVMAYITREGRKGKEVLVFRHEHHSEAGLQVPGGTVDEGETPQTALHREILEETGLSCLKLVGPLTRVLSYSDSRREWQERHVFHLEARSDLPSAWRHIVRCDGEDDGLHFLFSWIPVRDAEVELYRGHGEWLRLL